MIYQTDRRRASVGGGFEAVRDLITTYAPLLFMDVPLLAMLFLTNFLILFGPMILLGPGRSKITSRATRTGA